MEKDIIFMKEALKEAKKAEQILEVPVGAVIVKDNKIIARAYNQKETKCDTTKHAEILAIQKASKKLKAWRLTDCEMYVTLEPCSMCKEVIKQSRIDQVYYLLSKMDWKKEYNKTLFVMLNEDHSKQTYQKMLSYFFQSKRTK